MEATNQVKVAHLLPGKRETTPIINESPINVDIHEDHAIIVPVIETDFIAERKAMAEKLMRQLNGR